MNENCEKYFGLIEDLVEGEIDLRSAAQAESHVFDCPECRREYEFVRREKEVLAHYLFEFEPPPDSWINFQARLIEDEEKISDNAVFPIELPRRRKRKCVFGFSPALAFTAGLLLFFGISFVWLRNTAYEKNVAEIKSEDSPQSQSQLIEANPKTSPEIEAKNVVRGGDVEKNNEPLLKNRSLKSRNNSLFGKNFIVAEKRKVKQKIVAPNNKKKQASETAPNDETRAALRRRQNLETEIAGQIEKIELLLRSFRNAQADEKDAIFDVGYEQRQARKLLETNAALRRDAEAYEVSYAEEVLNRVEPYLLEIANLGSDPAPDKILDIKERVSNQNIIASLQVYSSVVATR